MTTGSVSYVRQTGTGAGAAFNSGLEAATGDIVTFLDDDNMMHPEWLRSVVWAFATFPDVNALYGAHVDEDPGAQQGVRSGMLPTLESPRYDRARHEQAKYIDRNTTRVAVFSAAHPLRRVLASRIRLGLLVATVRTSRAHGAPRSLLLLPHRRAS